MVSDVDESEPESVVEAIDNEDDEDDDDVSEPQPDNSKSRPKIKLLFKPKKGTKGQLNNIYLVFQFCNCLKWNPL